MFFLRLFSSEVKRNLFHHFQRMGHFYRQYTKNPHRLNKFSVLLMFFLLFAAINLSILASSIKTNQVILQLFFIQIDFPSTLHPCQGLPVPFKKLSLIFKLFQTHNQMIIEGTDFIDSKSKLSATSRYGCWFTDDTIFKFIKNSDPNGWLYKLMKTKRPGKELCIFDSVFHNPNFVKQLGPKLTKFFITSTKSLGYFVLTLISQTIRRKILFTTSFLDYELLQVHYIAKALERLLKNRMQIK